MQDKKTLIVIIVLLTVFLPLSILGTVNHFKSSSNTTGSSKAPDNPNKKEFFNGYVYFYKGDELVDTYKCKNMCGYVLNTKEEGYKTNVYPQPGESIPVSVNEEIRLFSDGEEVNFLMISSPSSIISLQAAKHVNIKNNKDVVILKFKDNWGATYEDMTIIPYEFDYLEIPSHVINGELDTSKLIAKKDNSWSVIEQTGELNTLFETTDGEIVDFNDNYYVVYTDKYIIRDKENNEIFESVNKDIVYCVDNYLLIKSGDNVFITSDGTNIVKTLELKDTKNIYFNKLDNSIEVMVDGNLKETIEL